MAKGEQGIDAVMVRVSQAETKATLWWLGGPNMVTRALGVKPCGVRWGGLTVMALKTAPERANLDIRPVCIRLLTSSIVRYLICAS